MTYYNIGRDPDSFRDESLNDITDTMEHVDGAQALERMVLVVKESRMDFSKTTNFCRLLLNHVHIFRTGLSLGFSAKVLSLKTDFISNVMPVQLRLCNKYL